MKRLVKYKALLLLVGGGTGALILVLVLFGTVALMGVVSSTATANAQPTNTCGGTPVPTQGGVVQQVGGAAPVNGTVSGLTDQQAANARTIVGTAVAYKLGRQGALVMVAAAYTESTLNHLAVNPSGKYHGLFQMSTAWVTNPDDRHNPQLVSDLFINGGVAGQEGLLDIPSWWTMPPEQAAEAVEKSGQGGNNYRKHVATAQAIVDSLLAGQDVPQNPDPSITNGTAVDPGPAPVVPVSQPSAVCPPVGGGTEWDPGNIFSDAVFYNAAALPDEAAVQAALDMVGATCLTTSCLRTDTYRVEGVSSPYCDPVPAEAEPRRYAHILLILGQACGFNPQAAIAMIIKESQGFTKPTPPSALTGFGCPDTGPGGSANCDPAVAGVWAQTAGLFTTVAKLREDPSKVNYPEGRTVDILWNIVESGCGGAPVAVANRATASLYTWTPYQPNKASLAAYPGEGDACSSYGNRNIFFLFQKYFGPTGGGRPVAGSAGAVGAPNGLQQNSSQDPSTFGWQHNGPMEPLVYQGHSFGQVAAGTAGLWTGMLNDLVPQIPGGLNNNLGCYADRQNVNSPGRLSFHAYGLACDINYDRNPNGADPASLSGPYVIPTSVAQAVAAKWGMEWGGDWGYPDPMHFELHLSPQQVASLTPAAA